MKWSDNNRIETKFANFADLLPALFQEMRRMFRGRVFGRRAIIQLFLVPTSGNPVIFHTGKFSCSARDWFQMLHGKIKTNVTIKFPISWISRIAFVRAPDLPTRVAVARKCRRSRWCVTGCVDRAARARFSKQQAVGVENEPANIRFLPQRSQTGNVRAFG